jgi:hypothetical protein
MCTTSLSPAVAKIQETILQHLTYVVASSDHIGPLTIVCDPLGTREEFAQALQNLIDAGEICIHADASESFEIFLTDGKQFESENAADSLSEWQRKWAHYISERSADEVELLRMITRTGRNGVCRSCDLRPALAAAGWSATRTRATLASLADRDDLAFYRSVDTECFIELTSAPVSAMDHCEGLRAFNLDPLAAIDPE